MAASPDGKLLACGSVRLFDTTSGAEVAAFDGHGRGITKMAFSPDSTRLYSGEAEAAPSIFGSVIAWDVVAKQHVIKLPAVDWALTPDGTILVTAEMADDNRPRGGGEHDLVARFRPIVRVRDTRTWDELAGYAVNDFRPTAVAVSPDGNTLALGGVDGDVRTWDRRAGKELTRLTALAEPPAGVRPEHYTPAAVRLTFDETGKRLAGSNGGTTLYGITRQVVVWDWPAGTMARRWTLGDRDLSALALAPDGRHVVAADGYRAAVWDAATGEAVTELNRDTHKRTIWSAAFAPGGDRLYVSTDGVRPGLVAFPSLAPAPLADPPFRDGRPHLPFETAGPIPPYDTREGRNSEITLPDGSRLRSYSLTRSTDWGVQLVGANGKLIHHFERGRVVEFDVTPDGRLLATYGHNADGQGYDYPLRFWDVASGKEVAAIRVLPRPAYTMRFSPDGTRLAVRHADGLVRVWDVAARKPLLALDPDGYWPSRLTYSKDGRSLVGGEAGSPVLIVWDATDPGGRAGPDPPSGAGLAACGGETTRRERLVDAMYTKARHLLARVSIGLAVLLGGLGLFISFVPGAEAGWFGTAAGLAAVGLLSPKWPTRLLGIGLVVGCAWYAWAGHQRGLRYQEWLREHGLPDPSAVDTQVRAAGAEGRALVTTPTKELPEDWVLTDIIDAMPPRRDDGPTHVLAWRIVEDDRPVRVEYCLAVKELRTPTENRERWVLANLVRNPRQGKEWNFVTIWITPDPAGKNPPFIMHVQEYRERPTAADLDAFMDKYRWLLGTEDRWRLTDGGICEAWEKVIGEKPTRSFKP